MADNIKLVTKEYVDTGLSTKANKVISNMSYESFIDTYHLREPEWVDLSFVGGEYYYTDFNTAVTDVNNGNTANATSNITGAVCQIFTDGNITVLRLLSDITITTNVVFTKSVIFDINGFTVTVRDSGRIGSQTVAYDISVIFYGAKTDSNILSTNMLVMFANTSNFFLIGGKYSINSSLAGAYVIYVPPYNIPINVEICNAELQVIYNNPQSTNNISCVIITNKTSITNLLINNTKCVTNGTNRYTYAYITTTTANPETKVTILNSDIEAYGADQSDNSPCGVLISAGYANIISSNIKGITSGIQVGRQGNVYIKDSKCYAPYHGGIYNAHILYAENTEFHRSATPEGYTPSGAGCAYFGYGSTAYINNCKFIRDVESDTSPGIAVKAGTAGAVTRVFVSNSEMPGIRCDADQEIYLGNGISDAIKNATVQGKKYITDNNYIYIEESNAAYSLLNPDFNAADKNYVDNNVGNITTTEAEEHAQIDSTEILTAQTGTWVTDGWTGDATTGFTHTSGNTSILKYPITGSDYTVEGTLYDITFNCSVAPTVDNIMVRIGNSDLFNLYGQEEPLNIGVKSKGSTDGTIYLEFIPSSTFTGTISNIKVHKITGTYVGKYKITDSNGLTSFEVRADTVNKYNAFIGVDSGSYNTTGNGNVGFGYKALASNTSGFWNTGIGFEALQFVNAGSRNIGIGALAGRHIETGQRNVAIGTHTFRENRTGNNNIAIGADSQINGRSGNNNISIGVASLSFIEGDKNIAIGRGAMAVNSGDNKGTSNIAIGENSLSYGSNTKGNIAIGEIAGYKISGNYNVAIGGGACRNGSNQVVVGYNSGNKLEADAFGNTILGANSGNNLKSNRFCILIGNTISGEETGDYQLNIGNLIKGSTQSSNKYVNIDGSLSAKSMSVDNVGTNDTDVVNKKYVDDAITTQVSSVYKAKGSIADISALPTPDKAHEGFVYNIENEFTTTDQFVEGAGTTFPAGTNVVCINTTGTTYKWDVLAGMVDLSDYATKTELSGKLDKVTSTSTYNRLYGIETTGNQALFNVAAYVLAGSIAQRKADGTLSATTPTADSSDDTVTTKKYVDDQIGNINSILATMFNDVSTQSDEEPTDNEEVIA